MEDGGSGDKHIGTGRNRFLGRFGVDAAIHFQHHVAIPRRDAFARGPYLGQLAGKECLTAKRD
jgi:hypothetical protein